MGGNYYGSTCSLRVGQSSLFRAILISWWVVLHVQEKCNFAIKISSCVPASGASFLNLWKPDDVVSKHLLSRPWTTRAPHRHGVATRWWFVREGTDCCQWLWCRHQAADPWVATGNHLLWSLLGSALESHPKCFKSLPGNLSEWLRKKQMFV